MTAYNPFYSSANRPLGKTPVRFSSLELQHLAMAVFALTLALMFVLPGNLPFMQRVQVALTDPINMLAAFLAVSSGFVFHELAHKFVAIKYGCLAEFRAQMGSLMFAVVFAVATGLVIAAPGAVQIYGRVNVRENGVISVAGPATNMAIALLTLPFIVLLSGNAEYILFIVGIGNGFLGAFNMLPFGPLDGKKVMLWSKVVWAGAFFGSILLALAAWYATKLAF